MVYVPIGGPVKVKLDKISADKVKASWFDPRRGVAALIGTFENRGAREFVPYAFGRGNDWVLVLEDAGKNLPPPGSQKK